MATFVVGCGDQTTAPTQLVPIQIHADPDLDTLRVGDSVSLTVRAESGAPPHSVHWRILPSGAEETTDTFVYRPAGVGTEIVRALAEFSSGAEGVAQRRFVTRLQNQAPAITIVSATDDDFSRVPLGFMVRLAAIVSDPDGDPIPDDSIQWMREVEDGVVILGTGPSLDFVPDSAAIYRLAAKVADPHSAFAIARYRSEAYDPLTPYSWRIRIPDVYPQLLSWTSGGAFVVHDGYRKDGGFSPCGCWVVAVSQAGEPLWEYPTPAAGAPLAVGPSGDIYLSRGISPDEFAGELLSLSPAGLENWVLPAGDWGGATFGPAILHDGTLAVPMANRETGTRWLARVTAMGEVLWATRVDGVGALDYLAIGSDTTIYVASGSGSSPVLTAVSGNGDVRWQLTWSSHAIYVRSLAIANDSTLLLSYQSGVGIDSLLAIGTDGNRRWGADVGNGDGATAVGNGVAFHTSGSSLRALSVDTGAELWRVTLTPGWYGEFRGAPVLTADGQVIAGAGNQAIAYSAATGQELWRHEFAGRVTAHPLLVDTGLLVFGDGLDYVEALNIGVGPLDSPWPMAWADAQRSGRVRKP